MRHQGKGLGVKAFTATADYAQKVLGVKPIAKCFKQNTNSQKMILASGFHKTGEAYGSLQARFRLAALRRPAPGHRRSGNRR